MAGVTPAARSVASWASGTSQPFSRSHTPTQIVAYPAWTPCACWTAREPASSPKPRVVLAGLTGPGRGGPTGSGPSVRPLRASPVAPAPVPQVGPAGRGAPGGPAQPAKTSNTTNATAAKTPAGQAARRGPAPRPARPRAAKDKPVAIQVLGGVRTYAYASGETAAARPGQPVVRPSCPPNPTPRADRSRSEERRVGKECRSRWSPY